MCYARWGKKVYDMKKQLKQKRKQCWIITIIMLVVLFAPNLKAEAANYEVTDVTMEVVGDSVQIRGRLNNSDDVQEVYFPTWKLSDNQKDLKWWKGTRNGTEISVTIPMKDYGYVPGEYITHIYVVDQTGYVFVKDLTFVYEKATLQSEILEDNSGYRVTYTVLDANNIDSVEFPTWTEALEQDDIQWYRANQVDNTFTYEVKRADHGNQLGIYYTDVYAHYKDGTVDTGRVRVVFPAPKANIYNVSTELDQNGDDFRISVQIEPNAYYQVNYAVWTQENGQDDIIWRPSDINQENHYFFWGKRSEHNNENDIYHIHAYIRNVSGDVTVFETKIDYTKPLPKLLSVETKNMTANAFDVVYKLEVPADVDIMNAVCPTWPKVSVPQITWNQPTIQWDDRIATITCHHEATNGEREYYSHLHLEDSLGRKILYGTEVTLK